MSNGSFGIVVEGEGDFDAKVYRELIRKICHANPQIEVIPADGKAELRKKCARLLRWFEHVTLTGGPVNKALVLRDTDGADRRVVEDDLNGRIDKPTYSFPDGIAVHGVVQEMETWLLADPAAIRRVANGRAVKFNPARPLEELRDTKGLFQEVLSSAGLNYTGETCRRIAQELDLTILRVACPSFGDFERKVLDP